jgi:hypothetical protein
LTVQGNTQAVRHSLRELAKVVTAGLIFAFVLPHPWPLLDFAFGAMWVALAVEELRVVLKLR